MLANMNIKLFILFIGIILMRKTIINISPWSYIRECTDPKPLIINGINASIAFSFLQHILPYFYINIWYAILEKSHFVLRIILWYFVHPSTILKTKLTFKFYNDCQVISKYEDFFMKKFKRSSNNQRCFQKFLIFYIKARINYSISSYNGSRLDINSQLINTADLWP